jgi:hypothetical protein
MLALFIGLGAEMPKGRKTHMPRVSVGAGPARISSGCCVVVVSVLVVAFFALGGTAIAAKQYVLKHPKHEHCKTHYVKKTKTIKKHGHKVKEIVCVYVAPKAKPVETVAAPMATTTTLTATPEKECKPVEGGKNTISLCTYTVAYGTVNSNGEAAPGEIVIKEHVPPSQEERKVAIPSGAVVSIGWVASNSSLSTECWLNSVINKVEQPKYGCEKQNPREILVAEYVPAPGYLTSKSEPATLQ